MRHKQFAARAVPRGGGEADRTVFRCGRSADGGGGGGAMRTSLYPAEHSPLEPARRPLIIVSRHILGAAVKTAMIRMCRMCVSYRPDVC